MLEESRLATLLTNAVNAGYNEDAVEVNWVTEQEFQSIDDITVALWEKVVECRPEAADALDAKRIAIKIKYPKP